MKLCFDTNVLVYAFDPKAVPAGRHAAAIGLLKRAETPGYEVVLALQSLGEFIHVAVPKCRIAPPVAIAAADALRAVFPVVAADEGCFERACRIYLDHGIPFRDALLLATAQRAGCALLLSEDGHDGMRVGGVTIVNPVNEKNRELLDAALPPTD
ncbi:PIN domain-containing protein [Azospirillum halopraeferens]|uniref:PIN domain-containing protein n=1 Tax=Azospirillum halopraeferens TaxID=34010 RepID=UPI0005586A18|nr:PIN domain-containing protein [Azospirillum halopraeferens]